MSVVRPALLAFASLALAFATIARAELVGTLDAQERSDGWQIARDAGALSNPVPLTPAILAKGRELYRSKCQRCHGPGGQGNGPDAERDDPPGDLTDGSRASRNPDGVMFYKIWNGRSKPKMPAFKTDISRDDAWTVVHYVKTLRKP
jgi:mono/diheme cytochrome c family protein